MSEQDPRATLAEILHGYFDNHEQAAGSIQRDLAERGVLLVTEEGLRAELRAVSLTHDLYDERQLDAAAATIFASLSGEVTE